MTMDRPRDSDPDELDAMEEEDDGYGASHGYGPGHGGPTGPGDVPAKGEALRHPHPPKEPDDEMTRPSEKAP
jgi:hypothetical protein